MSITGITVFSDPEKSYQVNLSKPKRASVYIDQYTGEIKGKYQRSPFFSTMFFLHRWLLDSRPAGDGIFWGKMIVGVSTLMFVFVLISGIVIWWPCTWKALKNSLKITARKGMARFWYGLHVAGGMYALLLILVMALTGLTWSFGWYRTAFYTVFGVDTPSRMEHGHAAVNMNIETGKAMPCTAIPSLLSIGSKCTKNWLKKIPAASKSACPTAQPVCLPTFSATHGERTAIPSTPVPERLPAFPVTQKWITPVKYAAGFIRYMWEAGEECLPAFYGFSQPYWEPACR